MNQTELNAILDEHDNYRNDVAGAKRADFNGEVFSGASFAGRNLAGAIFGDGQFPNSNFTGTQLHYVKFDRGDFTSCDFTGANVAYADKGVAVFTNSNIDDANDCIMLSSFDISEGSHAVCREDGEWTIRSGHNVFTVDSAKAYWGSIAGGENHIAAITWLENNHSVG